MAVPRKARQQFQWGVLLGLCCLVGYFTLADAAALSLPACPIPPTFDPGVGALYFCTPEEGERHLVAYARRSYTEAELPEDIWANFRGIFADRVWINVGMLETSDGALPAWDALASLFAWLQAIKKGDQTALEAFLAPLEANPTYSDADASLKRLLLRQLKETARTLAGVPLRVVLYHVHLPPPQGQRRLSPLLNAFFSLPSYEDLLSVPRLKAVTPQSEAKIVVAAGIWTYTWDEAQAARFVAEHYKGPADAPFATKFAEVYNRLAQRESRRQRLHDITAVTPERLHRYIEALRPTGAILHFAFAPNWASRGPGIQER